MADDSLYAGLPPVVEVRARIVIGDRTFEAREGVPAEDWQNDWVRERVRDELTFRLGRAIVEVFPPTLDARVANPPSWDPMASASAATDD